MLFDYYLCNKLHCVLITSLVISCVKQGSRLPVTCYPYALLLRTSRTLCSIKLFVVTTLSCSLTCPIGLKYSVILENAITIRLALIQKNVDLNDQDIVCIRKIINWNFRSTVHAFLCFALLHVLLFHSSCPIAVIFLQPPYLSTIF